MKHTIYFVDCSDAMLSLLRSCMYTATDLELIYAGSGYKQSMAFYNSLRCDSTILTNSLELLELADWNKELGCFNVFLGEVHGSHVEFYSVRQCYENLRSTNNLRKMYKAGMFEFPIEKGFTLEAK